MGFCGNVALFEFSVIKPHGSIERIICLAINYDYKLLAGLRGNPISVLVIVKLAKETSFQKNLF